MQGDSPDLQVVQTAYHVPDVFEAAETLARQLGAGPFFVFEHIPLQDVVHREAPATLDHSSAYGQLGDTMIELVQQHGDEPSVFRDRFSADQRGVHHVARFAPDRDAELARLAAGGWPTAMTARTADGVRFGFADARDTLGLFVEIYGDSPRLRSFYAMVGAAARDWDGREPVRVLEPRA